MNTTDPPAADGSSYFVFGGQDKWSSAAASDRLHFAYFLEERQLAEVGLWFEVRRIADVTETVSLSLSSTDGACQPKQPLGTFELNSLLEADKWVSTCAPLPKNTSAANIGFSIEGAPGNVGAIALGGIRFGPRCLVSNTGR